MKAQESGFYAWSVLQLWSLWEIWASKAYPWSFGGRPCSCTSPGLPLPFISPAKSLSWSLSPTRGNLRDRMRRGPTEAAGGVRGGGGQVPGQKMQGGGEK